MRFIRTSIAALERGARPRDCAGRPSREKRIMERRIDHPALSTSRINLLDTALSRAASSCIRARPAL